MVPDRGLEGVAATADAPAPPPDPRTVTAPTRRFTVVEPSHGWIALRLGDLWARRELAYFLVWRDIKVRYAQTALGALWVLLQPLTMMAIFALVFGRFAKLPSQGIPYAIFTLAAIVPWNYFSSALTAASQSLVKSEQLVSKVYFPRMLLPIGAAASFLVDLVLATALLLVLMPVYGIYPGFRALWLPLIALLPVAAAFGVGIFLAAVNVRYRDVVYVVPFLVQIWLFASPVAYSSSLFPARVQDFQGLNPMAGAILGFRWALLHTGPAPVRTMALSALSCLVLLLVALVYFRRVERHFADVI
jgi:lipopolysaccharide transport system permease protein